MLKKNTIKSSYFNIFLLIVAILISILLVISANYTERGYNIKVGDVSPTTFRAPRTIENTIKTEHLREAARNSEGTVYKEDISIKEKSKSDIENFLKSLDQTKKYYNQNYSNNLDQNVNHIQNLNLIKNILKNNIKNTDLKLTDNELMAVINTNDILFNGFKKSVISAFNVVMQDGIKDLSSINWDLKVYPFFEFSNIDDNLKSLGYKILKFYIKVDIVVDEEATEKQKEEKAKEVEPVMYLQGQNIVSEGEIITQEIFDLLNNLGFTKSNSEINIIPIVGVSIIVTFLLSLAAYYINSYFPKIAKDKKLISLLFTLYIVVMFLTRTLLKLDYYFIPILSFTMLVNVLIDNKLSLVLNMLITILTAILYKANLEYVIYFIITGTVLALISDNIIKRGKIIIVGFIISIINAIVCIGIVLFVKGKLDNYIINRTIFAFANGFLTIIISVGTLPFWETVFGVITPFKLQDLTNADNELLRKLSMEAPGTYHHSIIVANLSETAAYNIKANPNIAKVGGYYHDIGKLKYPNYFTENQVGENPHDYIDPFTSVKIIKEHVGYGMQLADEKKLPKVIKDIIEQHQGTTKIKYFYIKAKKENPDIEIKEEDFRYNYRIPQFKEAAIVMLADTVEAAVRSMMSQNKSLDEVKDFIKSLIKDKMDDGQLVDSELSIKDLDIIRESFFNVFKGMYHQRIPYPKEDEK